MRVAVAKTGRHTYNSLSLKDLYFLMGLTTKCTKSWIAREILKGGIVKAVLFKKTKDKID